MRLTRPRATKLSQITIDSDLALGAHNITLDAAQTVDGVDVSSHEARHVSGGADDIDSALDLLAIATHAALNVAVGVHPNANTHINAAKPHSGHGVITSGTFIGNETANRAIVHGLGRTPKAVFHFNFCSVTSMGFNVRGNYWIGQSEVDIRDQMTVTMWDSTNFYVGSAVNYCHSGNGDGYDVFWVAIG